MQKKGTNKKSQKTDWERLKKIKDEEINLSASPELNEEDFYHAEVGTLTAKVPVSIRLDQDVLDWFRARGPGYQTRINEVLSKYIQQTELYGTKGSSSHLQSVNELTRSYSPKSVSDRHLELRVSPVLAFASYLDHLASMYKDSGEIEKAKSTCITAVQLCAKALSTPAEQWNDVLQEMTSISKRISSAPY